MAQQDDQLKAYEVSLTVIKQQPNENRSGSTMVLSVLLTLLPTV